MLKPSLFEQMREYLTLRPDENRRTFFLEGKAVASKLSGALQKKLPERPWCEERFQRGIVTNQCGDALVVLATRETLDSDRRGAVHITLTTHGLDDDRFAAARDDWWSWWSSQVDSPQLLFH